jgi:hypothetical protein
MACVGSRLFRTLVYVRITRGIRLKSTLELSAEKQAKED